MKDILLQIYSYPIPTTPGLIDGAVRIAAGLGARLSAIAVQAGLRTPDSRIVNFVIGLSDFAEGQERKSLEACHCALARFNNAARAADVLGSERIAKVDILDVAGFVANQALYWDMLIVPLEGDEQIRIARAAIFASGRPVLTLRSGVAASATPLGTVMVAWDGSAPAARALSDSIPLLQGAEAVKVVVVVDDKPDIGSGCSASVLHRLKAHGIEAELVEVRRERSTVGVALEAAADRMKADLVVMGAYGRARTLEFLLGGATHHFLHQAGRPVMFSH